MKVNYLEVKSIIDLLVVDLSHNILILTEFDGENDMIWLVTTFEPPKTNGVDSIDYGTVLGIDITEYVSNNKAVFLERQALISSFEKFTMENRQKRMQFSKEIKWMRISK